MYILTGSTHTRFVVTPLTFMMMQERTRTICNPKLIAIFALRKTLKGQSDYQIARMRNFIISLDKGNNSDRGYNCETELSREHF